MRKVIGEENATMFSVFQDDNHELPRVANCPIENLDKALEIYGEGYYIRKHNTRINMQWVYK